MLNESWESIYQRTVELAALINKHCAKTGERFDKMVVVPRGGYYPANIVARELDFGPTDLLQASVGSYDGPQARSDQFKLGQMPSADEIKGLNLIIIDEVCETGLTLEFLDKYLRYNGAKSVRCGVLHYKPGKSQTGYKPDWFVTKTEEWVVYPWELHDKIKK